MLGLRPPFGSASIAANVPLDSNGFPVQRFSTRYHRGQNPRVWGHDTGFTDSVYSDGEVRRRSTGSMLRKRSPQWSAFQDSLGQEMGEFKNVANTSVMSFSPRSLSPRERQRKEQNLEPWEFKAPLRQEIKDLRNHKFWHVTLDYKPKPTSVNGYWHFQNSFKPCTQLTDLPRRPGTPPSPRDEFDASEHIGALSSPELSPRHSPRSRSPRSPRRSPVPELDTRRLVRTMDTLSKKPEHIGEEFAHFAREKKRHLANVSHTRVLFDQSKHGGGLSSRSHGGTQSEKHIRLAESITRLSGPTAQSYNDKKRAPMRRYRKYLTASLSSVRKPTSQIPEMVDSLGPVRREGYWWREPKPKEWGF